MPLTSMTAELQSQSTNVFLNQSIHNGFEISMQEKYT